MCTFMFRIIKYGYSLSLLLQKLGLLKNLVIEAVNLMRRWELDSVTYMNDKPTKQPCDFNLILLTCLAVASSFLFLVSSDFLFHSLALSFSSLAWLCFNLWRTGSWISAYHSQNHVLYVLKICQSCTLTIWGQCTVHKSNIYCYVSLNTHTYTYAPQQLEV